MNLAGLRDCGFWHVLIHTGVRFAFTYYAGELNVPTLRFGVQRAPVYWLAQLPSAWRSSEPWISSHWADWLSRARQLWHLSCSIIVKILIKTNKQKNRLDLKIHIWVPASFLRWCLNHSCTLPTVGHTEALSVCWKLAVVMEGQTCLLGLGLRIES